MLNCLFMLTRGYWNRWHRYCQLPINVGPHRGAYIVLCKHFICIVIYHPHNRHWDRCCNRYCYSHLHMRKWKVPELWFQVSEKQQLDQILTLKVLISMLHIHHQGGCLAAVHGITKSWTLNNNNNIHQQRRCGLQKCSYWRLTVCQIRF